MLSYKNLEKNITEKFPNIKISEQLRVILPKCSSIKIMINGSSTFNIASYHNFCGGIFIEGIGFQYGQIDNLKENIIEVLDWVLRYAHKSCHQGLASYISTVKQEKINIILKEIGFIEDFRIKNPNTNNTAIHWHLDLNEYCK